MPDTAMQMSQFMQPDWITGAGMWVGLIVSLLVFSAIFGDHWLARLGQTILVAAGLGYAAAVTWHAVVGLPFVQGLIAAPRAEPWNWIPIVLAVLLVVAAAERILLQGEGGPPAGGFRRVLRWGGVVPAALLLAAGIAVVAVGVVQGTLLPQFLAAARTGIRWEAPLDLFFAGLLTLVITASALVFWGLDPQHHLAGQPRWVQRLMRAWVWFGQRAVWLAAGAIFARLLASRTSLLIAEFEFMRATFASTGLWQIIQSWLPK
jgi:hypothetical protein